MAKTKQQFEGFYVPNSTQVPDMLFDELMADLSGAELKVVLYIIRRTFGFKKAKDSISLSQMVSGITTKDGKVLDRGTGLGKASVARAVKTLEEKGIIVRNRQKSLEKGDESTTYTIRILPVSHFETRETIPPEPTPLSQNETPRGTKMRQGGVSKRDTQGTVIQDTVKTVNVSNGAFKKTENKTDLRKLPDIEQSKEQTRYMAETILATLGDRHSQAFYYLVAAKIPETTIRQTLSEIKTDGAREPARVFSHRMKHYAEETLQQGNQKDIRALISTLAQQKSVSGGSP